MRRRISPVRLRATPSGLTRTRVSSTVSGHSPVPGPASAIARRGACCGRCVRRRRSSRPTARRRPAPTKNIDGSRSRVAMSTTCSTQPSPTPQRYRQQPRRRPGTQDRTALPPDNDGRRTRSSAARPEIDERREEHHDGLEREHDREQALGQPSAARRGRPARLRVASGSRSASLIPALRLGAAPWPRRPA